MAMESTPLIFCTAVAFCKHSKLIAAFIFAMLNQKYLAGNIGMRMTSDGTPISLWRSIGNFCGNWFCVRSIGLALGGDHCILSVKPFAGAASCLRAQLSAVNL